MPRNYYIHKFGANLEITIIVISVSRSCCGIMGKKIADLEGKLKTLNFRLKKTGDLKDKVSVEALVTAVVKF